MKKIALLLIVALLASVFSVAALAETQKVSARDTLVTAITNDPPALDPQNVSVVAGYQVLRHLYDTLVVRDENGEIQPALAESWEWLDNQTIRFHLRDDVVFHNGDKLTAEDVRYSIQRATVLPQSASIFVSFDGENTAVVDDLTVDVKLKEPFGGALNYLATTRGSIVNKRAVEELGETEFGKNPVGTGVLKFKQWVDGDRIELVKFDDYWGEPATLQTVIFRIIPDASVRAMELESGGVDILLDIPAADYERLREDPNLVTETGSSLTHELWLLSMTAEEFSDIRVREAFNIALDIPTIVRTVWGELGEPADSVFTDKVFGHVSIGPIVQDQERARELLKEAGYEDGFDTEVTFGESATTQAALEVAQQMWAQVGINVKITPLEQATYKENNAAGVTRFGRTNFTTSTGDPDHALANWQSGYKGALNPCDDYIDALMAQGRQATDEEERKAIYKELQEYCWYSYYSIPVVFIKSSYAYTNKLEGFVFNESSQPDLAHLIFTK